VKDKPHTHLRRENTDLIYTAKINLGQALTGTTLHIEHLDGRKLDIPINEIVKYENELNFDKTNQLLTFSF